MQRHAVNNEVTYTPVQNPQSIYLISTLKILKKFQMNTEAISKNHKSERHGKKKKQKESKTRNTTKKALMITL